MSKNKLQKFAEVLTFPNVYQQFHAREDELSGQHGKSVKWRGNWSANHFKNENPLTLELACGRGEYTLALASQYPDHNFIGIDIKGARIWKGAKIALNKNLENAAFLRIRVEQITWFFDTGEVDEIWITFPDPFPKKENRRLTAPQYLDRYRKILKRDAVLHLKTDNTEFFDYTVDTLHADKQAKILTENRDIYSGELPIPELEFKTYYEKMHLEKGLKIKYLAFRL